MEVPDSMVERRKQEISKESLQLKRTVEPRRAVEVLSESTASGHTKFHGKMSMTLMEQIVSDENVIKALEYLEKKKKDTSPGIDGMKVPALREYLRGIWKELKPALLDGTYQPQPVRRTEIPKDGGGTRMLGIPTVLDRFIQQSMLQIVSPIFDRTFSEHSHGYRKGHNQKMAVREATHYIQEGRKWIVDMDLSKFFDRVNHDILMSRVARKIEDKGVLKLIRKYLEAGVMINGVVMETEEGTAQGGPISPLLSNIMLDELDKELESRGHKFVRFADDFQVYVRSKRAGERVMKSLILFLEGKLKLKVNREKSAVDLAWKRTFLGFSFYYVNGEIRLRLAPKAIRKVKEKIREITCRRKPFSIEERIKKLNSQLQGWIGYFHIADMKRHLENLESWIRRRLRMCIWKQWKKVKTRITKLRGLGLPDKEAIKIANTRKGYWRIAKCQQLHVALNNQYWTKQGLISLVATYSKHR
jgi:group II intron reverse transcriptase/maturase